MSQVRPSKEFGKQAILLAKTNGFGTLQQIADELDVGLKTVERFAAGESSLKFGHMFRRWLANQKVDVSTLPPLDPDAVVSDDEPRPAFSDENWLRIGRLLSEYARPEWWRLELAKLTQMADAFEIQARELTEMSRSNASAPVDKRKK